MFRWWTLKCWCPWLDCRLVHIRRIIAEFFLHQQIVRRRVAVMLIPLNMLN
jgi:hypothetical protein